MFIIIPFVMGQVAYNKKKIVLSLFSLSLSLSLSVSLSVCLSVCLFLSASSLDYVNLCMY